MTTLKPKGKDKKGVPFYFDDIIQIYDESLVQRKESIDAEKAKAALVVAKKNKKAKKFSLMARTDCLEINKKGRFGKKPKLTKIPYSTIKEFFTFTDNPGFIVIFAGGKEIKPQLVVISTTTVTKTKLLADTLEKAKLAPENDLKNPISEPNTDENRASGDRNESPMVTTENSSRVREESPVRKSSELKRNSSIAKSVDRSYNNRTVTPVNNQQRTRSFSSSSSSSFSSSSTESSHSKSDGRSKNDVDMVLSKNNYDQKKSVISSSSSSSSTSSSSSSDTSIRESRTRKPKQIQKTKMKSSEKYLSKTSTVEYDGEKKTRCTFSQSISSSSSSSSISSTESSSSSDRFSDKKRHSQSAHNQKGGLFLFSKNEKFRKSFGKSLQQLNRDSESYEPNRFNSQRHSRSNNIMRSTNSSESSDDSSSRSISRDYAINNHCSGRCQLKAQ